jgi:hypothetical protein
MEMSAAFAAIGLFASYWTYSRTYNTALASGVFFFFTMEFLQAVQYFFIAPTIDSPICDDVINKILTVVGFLHICLQPYFCHVINSSLTKNEKYWIDTKSSKDFALLVEECCSPDSFWPMFGNRPLLGLQPNG